MCRLCCGTHVVHEVNSFSIHATTCPVCGPDPDEVWRARLENISTEIKKKKEEGQYVSS